ncbi:UNVERIFIED_ORG: hypothetical protein QE398_001536 [Atlantibacter sp. SORGH_AS 304]|jgi:hypothetical protein|nr:hypothetical protein [Atlantibacter sp. SORGH_AS_0304]
MVIILCKQGKMRFLPAHSMQPRIVTLVVFTRLQDSGYAVFAKSEEAHGK